jgi:hypothetical protein
MSFTVNTSYEKRYKMSAESAMTSRVGRKKRWSEDMQARFPEGTFERVEAVLDENEDRTDFVRVAVERELERRERRGRSRPHRVRN